MESMYCIGLDVHKKTISCCVKDASNRIHAEGKIPATLFGLDQSLAGCGTFTVTGRSVGENVRSPLGVRSDKNEDFIMLPLTDASDIKTRISLTQRHITGETT
jgi:hypothetical protein